MDQLQREALAHDFSADEKSLTIDGRALNFVDLGEAGRPVLLYVHGLMGTWRNWLFNLLPFTDRFRVIAVDLPGFGKSQMPAAGLTVENYADALKSLLGELGIDRVTLVGNSMGGQIGAIFAKKFPQLLDKLVLVDAAGFTTSGPLLRRLAPFAWILELLLKLSALFPKVIAYNKRLAAFFTKIVLWKPMQVAPELIMVLMDGVGKKGFVPAVRSISTTPILTFPGEISVDTVIIWGRHDWLIPKSDAFRFAKMIPQAELELMDDVGHIPMFEAPERFNALLDRHLPAATETGGVAATA